MIGQPENFGAHFFWIALPTILSLLASQWVMYFANRKRGEQKDKKLADQLLAKDNRLALMLEQYRLHEHVENEGPLSAENIRYPRTSSSGES